MDNTASTIVQDILRDRESGAARLVAECKQPMYEAAMALCGDHAMAEDLVFRTFERVLDRIATCRDESAFTAWMKSILRNEWLMSVRGAAVRNTTPAGLPSEVECMAEPDDGVEAVERSVDAALLRDAIDQLPADMREAILLRYFMGLPLLKAAKILAVPVGTINSRLHYARKALAARLGIAAKKPGVKALLIALALAALTAVGAAGIAAIRSVAEPEPEEAEVVLNAKSTENTEGALTGLTGLPAEGTDPEPADPSLSSQAPATNHETNGDSPQQVEAITANSNTNIEENTMNTQSVKSAAVKVLAAAALFCRGSAVAADYYHIVGSLDSGGESSLSGTSAARGWATSSNSTDIAVRGITAANSSYYFWSTNQTGSYHALRTPNNASYTSPATSEIVLLPKAYAYFLNKSCGDSHTDGSVATLTFNNTTLCEDSLLYLQCNENGTYYYCTQLGGSFDIKEGATLKIASCGGSGTYGTPCGVFRVTGKVTGSGVIESRLINNATAVTTKTAALNQSITGDISGFTGDLVVYRDNLTYPGDLKFELVNAASLPGDPPAGETSYVIVTNGATLVIDQDWVSPKNRVWDFGDGPRPTVEVAAGKTVEIKGAVSGSAGFKKSGAGTLVLSGASPSFSGECLISTGKVVLKGTATSLKDNFGTTAYLDAPCSSYINTGYRPNRNTRVVMDVTVQGKREYWFGVWDTQYNRGSFLAANDGAASGVVHFAFGDNFNNGPALLSNGRHIVDFNKGVLEIDGSGRYTATTTDAFRLNNSLYLFVINKAGTPYVHDDEQGTIRMHSCRIYDNGTLVRDYTPRQRNGEWMLYEARSGSYVGNSGAGTFGGGISDSLEVIVGSVYYLR